MLLQWGVGFPLPHCCRLHSLGLRLWERCSLTAGFKPSSLLSGGLVSSPALRVTSPGQPGHALQALELKPADLPSTAGDGDRLHPVFTLVAAMLPGHPGLPSKHCKPGISKTKTYLESYTHLKCCTWGSGPLLVVCLAGTVCSHKGESCQFL